MWQGQVNSLFSFENSNFLYQIENVVCHPFRTATLVDNETIEGQIGEGCRVIKYPICQDNNRGQEN